MPGRFFIFLPHSFPKNSRWPGTAHIAPVHAGNAGATTGDSPRDARASARRHGREERCQAFQDCQGYREGRVAVESELLRQRSITSLNMNFMPTTIRLPASKAERSDTMILLPSGTGRRQSTRTPPPPPSPAGDPPPAAGSHLPARARKRRRCRWSPLA
jgi:hypothetical protein